MVRAMARANHGVSQRERFARLPRLEVRELGRPHGRVRLRNYVSGQLDVRVDPIYDFASTAINTAVALDNLFSIPVNSQYTIRGGATIAKTYYHTNLVVQNSLDAPRKMLVKNIAMVSRSDMSIADLNALNGQTIVTFNVLGKEMWRGIGMKIPAGAGAFASGGATFTAPQAQFSTANGWPSAQNMALITDDVPDIPGYAPPPPITGVLIETAIPFGVSVDPTQTGAAAYTTANSTTTVPGYVSVGWYYWIYLEGVQLVAIT